MGAIFFFFFACRHITKSGSPVRRVSSDMQTEDGHAPSAGSPARAGGLAGSAVGPGTPKPVRRLILPGQIYAHRRGAVCLRAPLCAVLSRGDPRPSPRAALQAGLGSPAPMTGTPTARTPGAKRSTNQLAHLLKHVLPTVWLHEWSWPFRAPVDPVKLNIPVIQTATPRAQPSVWAVGSTPFNPLVVLSNHPPPHGPVHDPQKAVEARVLGRRRVHRRLQAHVPELLHVQHPAAARRTSRPAAAAARASLLPAAQRQAHPFPSPSSGHCLDGAEAGAHLRGEAQRPAAARD